MRTPSSRERWLRRLSPKPLLGRILLYGGALALLAVGQRAHSFLQGRALAAPQSPSGARVYRGDLGGNNLQRRLRETGSTSKETLAVARALARAGGGGRLYAGDTYEIVRAESGELRSLTLVRGLKRTVLTLKDGACKTASSPVPVLVSRHDRQGRVHTSLWLSMQSEGVPASVIQAYADVFQWTVDFLTEPRGGDHFALTWSERKSPDGRIWGRDVEAALYDGKAAGKHVGVLYADAYYDEKGRSLERMFLRAPLNYRRISSYFSSGRFHPVLRKVRPHHGTDYAAPYGTPVVSIGQGRVVRVGWRGGLGKHVEVRHNGNYSTLYGHLSGYARGVRPGAHVRQGEVIGFVGATGLATGAHLHFQISKSGRWVDFLRLKVPQTREVPAARMAQFKSLRDGYLKQLGDYAYGGGAAAK